MFTIIETPEFTHRVRVQVPVDGGHEEQTFMARFRVLDDPDPKTVMTAEGVRARLRDIVVEITDLATPQGEPVSWSDKVREQLFAQPHVRIALLQTYRDALSKERAGN